MIRKIIKYLFLLGLIAGSAYFFLQLKSETKSAPNPFRYLLKESTTILKYDSENWSELMDLQNQLNKEGNTSSFKYVDDVIYWLDTMRSKSSIVPEILNNGAFYLSHFNSNEKEHWVLTAGLKNNEQGELITALLESQLKGDFVLDHFQNVTYAKAGRYYVLIENEVLFASNQEMAIKSIIQSFQTQDFLHKDPDFKVVSNATSNNAINIWKFNAETTGRLPEGWISYEPAVIDNNFQLVGYHFTADPKKYIQGKVPTKPLPIQLIPDHNIQLVYKSIERVKYEREQKFDSDSEARSNYVDYILQTENQCECLPEDLIFNNTQYIIEMNSDDKSFLLFDYDNFLEAITDYYPLIDSTEVEYKGNPIFQIQFSDLYSNHILSSSEYSYFAYVQGHFLMTENLEDLQWWLNQIKSRKTLEYKSSFVHLKNQISPSDWMLLSDKGIINSSPLDYPFAQNSYSSDEFQFMQIANEGRKSYVRMVEFYRGNNGEIVQSNESKGPMTIELGQAQVFGPVALKNHYTKEKEIFVQTSNNTAQLYSPSGKLLWEKKLDGTILGKVYQIDIYKNNKLQMVFNTANTIYCLDRNGNSVDGFPISLSSKATTEVKIFDYDTKKKYRILIACEDGLIYNYGIDGKKTNGWKYDESEAPIVQFEHIKIKDKDYIITLASDQKLQVLKRNGNIREKTDESLSDYANKGWHFSKGTSLSNTSIIYMNTKGELISKSILEEKKKVIIPNLTNATQVTFGRLNEDKIDDFILVNGKQVKAFDSKGEFLFQYDCQDRILKPAQWIAINKSDSRIALQTEDLIYLLNNKGELIPKFPVGGSSQVILTDLNLNSLLDLVTIDKSGDMIIYELN